MSQQWWTKDRPFNEEALDYLPYNVDDVYQSYGGSPMQDSSSLYSELSHKHLLGTTSISSSSPGSLTFSTDGMSQVSSIGIQIADNLK